MTAKIINTKKVGNTINFKFVFSGVPEWADGVYWGNAEVFNNKITETSNYYVASETSDGTRAVLGYRTYENGGDECDCEACFAQHTEGFDEDEKARLRQSLEWNGQHVCGTGYSFACPYDNGVDEQCGLDYEEVESLLKLAGVM